VLLDLEFPTDVARAARRDRIQDALDYKRIAKATIAFVEKSRYQLVETLAERLAEHLLAHFGLPEIRLKVSKPGAIRGSQDVGVEIIRRSTPAAADLVYLSLGSNIDPLHHLKNALMAIDARFGLMGLSHLYETSPVGGRRGQAPFLNLVVSISTDETPVSIRRWTDRIEKEAGRRRGPDPNASRTLDIDLILWKGRVARSGTHPIPHPDIEKKAFVLFPLLEIAPRLVIPGSERPIIEIAHAFQDRRQSIRQLKDLPPSTFKTWPVTKGWTAKK
jgi:2-amino-4-hydroxy-6-hydroxymethyldihydropteridine diphosphokinase